MPPRPAGPGGAGDVSWNTIRFNPLLKAMAHAGAVPGLPELLDHIHNQLLPEIRLHCPDPHDPVRVQSLPNPWRILGCGNYAAVLHHPHHPALVVKVYGPGRPGLEQEAEVYGRIGSHPTFSQCLHVGAGYLVLRRLHGTTLYDCLRQGHDVHGRNVMLHQGRGLVVDISDFLNPEPCRAWGDLWWAYHTIYHPLLAPLRLRVPGTLLDGLRRSYRLFRRLRKHVG